MLLEDELHRKLENELRMELKRMMSCTSSWSEFQRELVVMLHREQGDEHKMVLVEMLHKKQENEHKMVLLEMLHKKQEIHV